MPVANASQYNPTHEVKLPSQEGTDLTVMLRRPDIFTLIDPSGEVTDPLTNMLIGSLKGKSSKAGNDFSAKEFSAQDLVKMQPMLNRIAVACCVAPKFTLADEGDDEHIPVRFMSLADKIFIMRFAMGGATYERIANFRAESGGDVEAVPTE